MVNLSLIISGMLLSSRDSFNDPTISSAKAAIAWFFGPPVKNVSYQKGVQDLDVNKPTDYLICRIINVLAKICGQRLMKRFNTRPISLKNAYKVRNCQTIRYDSQHFAQSSLFCCRWSQKKDDTFHKILATVNDP